MGSDDPNDLGFDWSEDLNRYVHSIDFSYIINTFQALEYNMTNTRLLYLHMCIKTIFNSGNITESIIDSFEYNDIIVSFLRAFTCAPKSTE